MIKNPFLSVITVCYNSERFIRQTIESVLTQDFKDYEYIIVDGQSKDGTLSVIQELEPAFNGRLHWISEPDKGIYDAMNKGINMAKGRLIWFVNSDDFMAPGAMQIIYDTYTNYDNKEWPVISFAYNQIDIHGNFKGVVYNDKVQCYKNEKVDRMGILHPATIVPREVYERQGTFDILYRVIADFDWFRRIVQAGEPIDFYNVVVTNMRDGGASASDSRKSRLREYRYYCNKNFSGLESHWRYFRLWRREYYARLVIVIKRILAI